MQGERELGRYGEPWKAVEGFAQTLCADHEWLRSLSEGAGGVVKRERARRAETCVNACEGIADPAKAIALLRKVANEDPGGTDSYENPVCWFCGVVNTTYTEAPEVEHLDSCVWARIRRALGMQAPPAAPAWVGWDDGDGENGGEHAG
jgi:hypothetical protein